VLGAKTLAQLVAAAAGRVIVMPAAGIDAENVGSLIRLTHAREVHASLGSAGMGRSASGAAGTSSVEVLAFEGRVRKLVAAIAAIDDVAE
jgi:copper homeostasis protein